MAEKSSSGQRKSKKLFSQKGQFEKEPSSLFKKKKKNFVRDKHSALQHDADTLSFHETNCKKDQKKKFKIKNSKLHAKTPVNDNEDYENGIHQKKKLKTEITDVNDKITNGSSNISEESISPMMHPAELKHKKKMHKKSLLKRSNETIQSGNKTQSKKKQRIDSIDNFIDKTDSLTKTGDLSDSPGDLDSPGNSSIICSILDEKEKINTKVKKNLQSVFLNEIVHLENKKRKKEKKRKKKMKRDATTNQLNLVTPMSHSIELDEGDKSDSLGRRNFDSEHSSNTSLPKKKKEKKRKKSDLFVQADESGAAELTPIRHPDESGAAELTPIRHPGESGAAELTLTRQPVESGATETTPIRHSDELNAAELTPIRHPIELDQADTTDLLDMQNLPPEGLDNNSISEDMSIKNENESVKSSRKNKKKRKKEKKRDAIVLTDESGVAELAPIRHPVKLDQADTTDSLAIKSLPSENLNNSICENAVPTVSNLSKLKLVYGTSNFEECDFEAYNFPPKHELLCDWHVTKKVLDENGIKYMDGTWTEVELRILNANIKKFTELNNILDFREFYKKVSAIKPEKMYFELAENIYRPIRQIKVKVESLYPESYIVSERKEFSEEEIKKLFDLQKLYGSSWKVIAKEMGRKPSSVKAKFAKCKMFYEEGRLFGPTKLSHFTKEEDKKLFKIVEGISKSSPNNINWAAVSKGMGTRTGNACRQRWLTFHNNEENVPKPVFLKRPAWLGKTIDSVVDVLIKSNINDRASINWNAVAKEINSEFTPSLISMKFAQHISRLPQHFKDKPFKQQLLILKKTVRK